MKGSLMTHTLASSLLTGGPIGHQSASRKAPSVRLGQWLLVLVLSLFLGAIPSLGQSNAVDGAIDGYVTDNSGGTIPEALVTIRNTDTNVSAKALSGKDGYYRFPLVTLGRYEITVVANGYAKYVASGVSVAVGATVTVSPKLAISGVQQEVVVTADASILTESNASVGGLIGEQEMHDLPEPSRNVYNLFLFTPGTKGVPSSTFGTPSYSFGGLLRSSWNVDGLDDTARRNTSPIRLVINTPETVRQVQVMANGYQSEYGFTVGGQTNLITRSGSNAFHGSGMYLKRPKALSAIPGLGKSKDNLSWYMYDFNASGPIVRDRLFFFANFEHNPYTLPVPVTITAANTTALGLPPEDLIAPPAGETYDTPSLRVDYTMNSRNSGFVRYAKFHNWQPYFNSGGLYTPSRSINYTDAMDGGELQLATTFSPTLLNELRYGINRREQMGVPAQAGTAADAYTNITSVANLGNNSTVVDNIETSNQIVDNLSWQHGRHFVKMGGTFSSINYFNQAQLSRTFTFGGLAKSGIYPAVSALNQYLYTLQGVTNPATGKPYTYTTLALDFGDSSISRNAKLAAGFIQDEYRITNTFTLYAGLRYEKVFLPKLEENAAYAPARKVRSSNHNFAPRLAFTWRPSADSKSIIRGAFGLYFDTPNMTFFTNAASQDGTRLQSYTIAGTAATAPVYPNLPTSVGSTFAAKPNLLIFDPNFRLMYAEHGNLQFERALSANITARVQYMYVASHFGSYLHDTNLGTPTSHLADGRPVYSTTTRPNSSYGAINMYSSGSDTNYHGLDAVVSARMSHGLLFTAYYSYSHSLGSADQTGVATSDPSNVSSDYGNLSSDLRHYFTFRGSYKTKFNVRALKWASGFTTSLITMLNSGYPLNPLAGADLNGDLVTNDRPLFMQRNSFRGPKFQQIDARVMRTFTIKDRYHIEGIIEAENLLNHLNANCTTSGCNSAITGTYTSANFGRVVTARAPRRLEIGGRFYF